MNELSLFTGAGGGLLASSLLGWNLVACCEVLESQRARLRLRMQEGLLPEVPIHDDIRTLDGNTYRGKIDVISGGFPCQDISCVNQSARGINGKKSGLWREYARIIEEVQPEWVFAENAKELRTRGLNLVLEDLANLGYNAAWDVIGGEAVGAPQTRKRMWVVAHSSSVRASKEQALPERHLSSDEGSRITRRSGAVRGAKWGSFPGVPILSDGMARVVGDAIAYGNGQIPVVAAFAFTALAARLEGAT